MITILDGAMGTMIQATVPEVPKYAETLNLTAGEVITAIHRKYVEAGSQILCTNTFTCNSKRAAAGGYDLDEVVAAAIANARRAGDVKVALDVGPLGEFIEPYGDLSEDEARAIFRALGNAAKGADMVYIETMADLREARIAAEELKAASGLPLFATFTFARAGKTITGAAPADAVKAVEELVDAVGLNCSLGPVEALPLVKEFRAATDKPIIAKANAGMPDSRGNYAMSPADFAAAALALRDAGADYLGGCCGTTPEFITALKAALM